MTTVVWPLSRQLRDVIQIAAGWKHAVALRKDGTVWAWGRRVAAVYLGGPHSIAVRADGTLWIWVKSFIENGPGLLGKNLHVPTRLDLN